VNGGGKGLLQDLKPLIFATYFSLSRICESRQHGWNHHSRQRCICYGCSRQLCVGLGLTEGDCPLGGFQSIITIRNWIWRNRFFCWFRHIPRKYKSHCQERPRREASEGMVDDPRLATDYLSNASSLTHQVDGASTLQWCCQGWPLPWLH